MAIMTYRPKNAMTVEADGPLGSVQYVPTPYGSARAEIGDYIIRLPATLDQRGNPVYQYEVHTGADFEGVYEVVPSGE